MLERDDDFVAAVIEAAREEQTDVLLAARVRELVKERQRIRYLQNIADRRKDKPPVDA